MKVTNVKGEEVDLEDDFGAQAAKAAEEHLAACWEHFNAENEGEEMEGPNPSIGAFNGCGTCEVREMMYAAIPFLQAGFHRDGRAPDRPYILNLVECPWKEEVTSVE